jgi:hypothetical protein
MTDPRAPAFRGTRATAGFLLDAGLIGEAEARRRVIERWSGGARVHTLPDGRWLLLLGAPVTVRAERAPGLCVTETHGAYTVAAAQPDERGTFTGVRHGAVETFRLADLPRIDPAAWLAGGPRQVVDVEALDRPAVPTPVAPRTEVEEPDLRKLASVGAASESASKAAHALRRAADEQATAAARPPSRDLLKRLLLRTPAANVIGRRHRRYLDALTRSFEQRDYDKALRDAIALGAGMAGALALRLPAPRRGRLAPTPSQSSGGAGIPWGPTVHDHLSTLYRRAAEQLERDGQIEEAAFIYADLLDAPNDAVMLLERHRRFELAARLAEGRELDPDLVVRLWWLAGDRRRAIDIARARGAWAAAIERLQATLPEEAAALRAEWVAAARQAGDHRLAVEAAWPDPVLRDGLADDLAALRRRGGRAGARALVRQLAWRPDDALLAEAATLIADRDPANAAVRSVFVDELSGFASADPAADRQLATGAMRAILRDGRSAGSAPEGTQAKSFRMRLRSRADPLLRADLPPMPPAGDAPGVPLVLADAEPGGITLRDAVVLDHGLLIASGTQGLRLLTLDGRPRGRWDIVADALCVADHGDAVLVIGGGESIAEIHRFDLTTRRARRCGAFSRTFLAESFDGGVLTTLDAGGIAHIDVTEDQPRELWRELDKDTVVYAIARSPACLSAIVNTPLQARDERSVELWTWELPSRRLRRRELAHGRWPETATTTAAGTLLWCTAEDSGATTEHRLADGHLRSLPAPEGAYVIVSGDIEGLVDPDGPRVALRRDGEAQAVVELPGVEDPRIRSHADVVTVWAPDGRIVAVDLATRATLVNLTVRTS